MKPKDEGDYELIEPFETNDNSLKGVNSEIAFTLGVEWQMFRQRLKTGRPFQTLCLSLNTNRLVKMAERQRRFVEDRPTPWAVWSEIWVGDYLGRVSTTNSQVMSLRSPFSRQYSQGGNVCPAGMTRSTEWPQLPTARYTPETGQTCPVVRLIS